MVHCGAAMGLWALGHFVNGWSIIFWVYYSNLTQKWKLRLDNIDRAILLR
jgi:hypothetical protein